MSSPKSTPSTNGSTGAKKNDSAAGITALISIAIILVLNYLVGGAGLGNFRLDLTENKIYTLSEGTRKIIGRIPADTPVTIRFYETTDDRVMPSFMKPFARTVEDLLLEFEKDADGRIVMEKFFPNPNTDDEDKAREDDMEGRPVNQEGDRVYLGFSVQCAGKKEVVPFILPNEETQLEYYAARAINKVIATKTPVIGIMSPLPVQGSPMFPFQRQRGQEPWQIVQQLRRDYEVRDVPMTADKIDDDISTLIVIHPGDITDRAEYAIDQYVLKGGKVMAFVDPLSLVQRIYNSQPNPMTGQSNFIAQSSDLPNLFKAWGIGYKKDMVTTDMANRDAQFGGPNPTFLLLRGDAIAQDYVTQGLPAFRIASGGAFAVGKVEGIDAKPLLETSEASGQMDSATAENLRDNPNVRVGSDGTKKIVAVRLTGKFKTAFPNGAPKAPEPPKEGGGAQQEAGAPAAAPAPATAAPAPKPAAAPAASPAAAPAPAKPAAKGPAAPPPAAPAPTTPAAPPAVTAPAPSATPAATAPAATPATTAPATPAAPVDDGSLKESKNDQGIVMLFADADMLYDELNIDRGQGVLSCGNIPMVLNSVESLAGGGDLLGVRSRVAVARPFVKLDEMRAKVEQEYRPLLEEKEQKLQEAVQKLASRAPNANGVILVDPAKDVEFKQLKETQVALNRDIRDIKKKQTADVDRIKGRLMWLNIAAMPLLVIIVGLLLAMRRQSSTAAR